MCEVIIAGAGCGSIRQLTLEVKEAIEAASCILYDDLINPDILELNRSAKKIHTGKRAGRHSMKQEEINQLLISCAAKYPLTLRLKGGDPFVFGRGFEEAAALATSGISFHILPGLSSCISIPERCALPVTSRGAASSFMVITAHTSSGSLFDQPAELLAAYSGTLVVLMGFSRLKEICQQLIVHGKDPATPASLLYSPEIARTIRIDAALESLPGEAEKSKACAPAILVIGACAGLHLQPELKRTIHVISTSRFYDKIRRQNKNSAIELVQAGILTPCLLEADNFKNELQQADWLVFTSQSGIDFFFETLRKKKIDIRSLADKKTACIGQASADCLSNYSIYADLISEPADTPHLAKALVKQTKENETILTFRAQSASNEMEEILKEAGRHVRRIDLYQLNLESRIEETEAVKEIIAASAAAVRLWMNEHPETQACWYCIGEQTLKEAAKAGKAQAADSISAASLLELVDRQG